MTAAVVVLTQMSTLTMAYAFGVMYGLSTGAEIVGRQITWPIYFGTKHLGKLKGFSAMSAVCGSSLGPFALGWSFDNLGGFGPALWCLAGVYAVIAMLMPMAAQPRRDQTTPRRKRANSVGRHAHFFHSGARPGGVGRTHYRVDVH